MKFSLRAAELTSHEFFRIYRIVFRRFILPCIILTPLLLCLYFCFDWLGLSFLKILSALLQTGLRALLVRFVGWGPGMILLCLISAAAGGESLHMMMAPAGGEGGSGAGSSQRPVHLDLTLPPGGRDELSAVMDDLAEAERKIQKAETEIQQIQQALQEIEGLNESRVEGLQANLQARERELARLRTCLSEVDERVEQARSMDEDRNQERARQRAELRAQIEPFLQEARLAARRQALAEVLNSLQQQLWAQAQFLQEAGEGDSDRGAA